MNRYPARCTSKCSLPLLHAFCAIALAGSLASSVGAADLTVNIDQIRKATGKVMLNVLQNEAQMAGTEAPYASIMLPPKASGVSFTLHGLTAGNWGVQVMHDENGNGELDSNLLGIPKEPWAFSNNATGKFGPPKWQDLQFEIDADDGSVDQTISLNH